MFRRWLIKRLLGERLFNDTMAAIDLGVDANSSTATDPAMHRNEEELAVCRDYRRMVVNLDKFWRPNTEYSKRWAEETEWLG